MGKTLLQEGLALQLPSHVGLVGSEEQEHEGRESVTVACMELILVRLNFSLSSESADRRSIPLHEAANGSARNTHQASAPQRNAQY
eukprot:763253-Hanusia_phi.AAC.1